MTSISQEKDRLTKHLEKILAVCLQARSLEYLHKALVIPENFFLNAYWYSLLNLCSDAMIEYDTEELSEEFLLRFIQKKKLLAGVLLSYKEFMEMDVQIVSIHRLKLEVDIYLEDISKVMFRQTANNSFKNWEDSSYDQIKKDIFTGINTIDMGRGSTSLPEGNINRDMDDVVISIDTETPMNTKGVLTGFPQIDQKTGGFIPGDLIFVLAYTSQGKSTLLQNFAYNVMLSGKNCVYFVNELQYKQVKVKFLSRHTANPDFWGGQLNGVATKAIEEGTLSPNEKKVTRHAATDIRNNKGYGRIYVVQLESGASVSSIEAKLTSLQTAFDVDFVVIDDLRLCTGNMKGEDKKVLSKVVINAKKLAVNFNGGKGVPIASPWQTKQTSFETAKETGKYAINVASDTNEVEKQADIMLWLLQTEDLERKHQVLSGMTKNRMGPKIESHVLMENWSYGYMSELSDVVAESGGNTVPEISSDDYDTLLADVLNID